MAEPQQYHSSLVNYAIFVTSTVVSNGVAWAQSTSAGSVATGITIIGSGFIGLVVLWYQKVAPTIVDFKVYRDKALKDTLIGQMAGLSIQLENSREMSAMQNKQLAVAQRLAADAEKLANINQRMMDQLATERAKIAADLRKSQEENKRLLERIATDTGQIVTETGKIKRRTDDANKKLHDQSTQLQTVVNETKLAVKSSDEIIFKLDRLDRPSGDNFPAVNS